MVFEVHLSKAFEKQYGNRKQKMLLPKDICPFIFQHMKNNTSIQSKMLTVSLET